MNLSRRNFLQTAGAFTLGFGGLHTLFQQSANATPLSHHIAEGFGPILRDPDKLLDLPRGFHYSVIARAGDPMNDGFYVPGKPDGTAAFAGPEGQTILICNHENSAGSLADSPYGADNRLYARQNRNCLYDNADGKTPCIGGTTTLHFDTNTQTLQKHFMSLAGTERNCAGGPTPWNTWVSCEETVQRAVAPYTMDHGYCFEVPAQLDGCLENPKPIVEMGRFNHEAIAVDPATSIVYLTEDRDDGLLYRFIPNTPGKLHDGGKLQALAIKGAASIDTRNWADTQTVTPNRPLEVEWIDLEDIHSPEDDLRHRGFDRGAACFARGEGIWYGNKTVYFACTNGGIVQKGQIWKYHPSPAEGTPGESDKPGQLTLFIEPNDGGIIDMCDNVTVTPWGDLILCEDGKYEQHLVGVTPTGGIYKFARNALDTNSEFAGACFSPDGTTMFVNIQGNGLTLAITGPWRSAITG